MDSRRQTWADAIYGDALGEPGTRPPLLALLLAGQHAARCVHTCAGQVHATAAVTATEKSSQGCAGREAANSLTHSPTQPCR